MPVHLAQMNALETEDSETWCALKSGGFVVIKPEIPFTHLFTGQALEQEIIKLKVQGEVVGLSRDEGALDRLVWSQRRPKMIFYSLQSWARNDMKSLFLNV